METIWIYRCEVTMSLDKEDSELFAKKTFKEITIWDWAARILPLIVLAIVTVLHFLEESDLLSIILEITAILFLIICFFWWWWALYKIAATIKYMNNAHNRLKEVLTEFKLFRKDLKNEKDSSNR
jgi:hypothetical protein